MKRNFFVIFFVALLFCIGCGGGGSSSNTTYQGDATVAFSGNQVVGSTITGTVEGRISSVKVTDIDGAILIQAPDEVARNKFYTDANDGISIDVDWDGAIEIAAWKAGVYLIKGDVDDGRGFSGVIVVDELAVSCEFIKGDYETPAKIKISSNGENMEYLVRLGVNDGALTTLKPPCEDTEYDIGILEENTPFQVEVSAYCQNPTFTKTIETAPTISNYNSGSYNHPPNITEVSPDPDPNAIVEVNKSFTASIVATDEDGDLLTYAWSASDPNVTTFSDSNSAETDVVFSKAGKYTLTAAVSDGELIATAQIPLIAVSEAGSQEEDPNSLYEDADKIVAIDLTLHRDGILKVQNYSRYLLENETAAYLSGAPVHLLAKLNGWVIGDQANVDLANDTVTVDLSKFGLEEGDYGIGLAVVPNGIIDLSGVNWWQYYQFLPKDQKFFGYNSSNPPGIVFIFHVDGEGKFDNLPQGTVVEN